MGAWKIVEDKSLIHVPICGGVDFFMNFPSWARLSSNTELTQEVFFSNVRSREMVQGMDKYFD
jgi:hypothetical protein